MLAKIKLQPGINRDTTSYTNSGGWFDSDFIRFRNGLPEKIGGWVRVYENQTPLIGKCRKLYDWSDLVGTGYLACPTNIKFYVDNSTSILDITPLRREVTLGTDPIITTGQSNTITITDVNHGAVVGDYITISGATDVGGLDAADINGEWVVSSVINANAYSVTVAQVAESDSIDIDFVADTYEIRLNGISGGGSNVVVKYQFHPGIDQTAVFEGWGSGGWGGTAGTYGWGDGPSTTITTYYSGLWSVDNYGEDMIACPRDLTNGVKIDSNAISATNTSNVVTITQINHAYSNGNAIVISGVPGEIGGIPVSQLNGTHTISVVNANAFSFTVANTATLTETGGGTNAYAFISSIVYWDVTDVDGPAVSLSTLGPVYAKAYMPYVATEILISDQNRQVIAFGTNPYDVNLPQDKMIVRWSDSLDPTNWDISDTTKTAGEQRLSSGSYIVTAVQNREEILVWTDTSLYSMQYVGPPTGYGFNLVGANFDIIGPNAKIVTGAIAYWMGSNNFYTYSGKVEPMPCTVRDYVFLDISVEDGDKVYCSADSGNNEIIWFYPSASQGGKPGEREVDRYVVYNYIENAWYYGTLARTAWVDRRGSTTPRAAGADGYLYQHEVGFDDGSTTPASPINAYIQSSPIEIEDGNNFLFINRVLPDLTFRNSTTSEGVQPTVKFTIRPQDYPGGLTGAGNERSVQRNSAATIKVNRFTDQVFTRLRARSVALRIESDTTGVSWRLGTPRFDMRQDGRK